MSEIYLKLLNALKDFVRTNINLLNTKSAISDSKTAKLYTEKGNELLKQYKEMKEKMKKEMNGDKLIMQLNFEKRCAECRTLQQESIRLQSVNFQLLEARRAPALYNANAKWKTPRESLTLSRTEACSHLTQYMQDRRHSVDVAELMAVLSRVRQRYTEESGEQRVVQVSDSLKHRIELVSHIMVDDSRRQVSAELYSDERTWLRDVRAADAQACEILLNPPGNNSSFYG